jgi:hypothetical protein
MKHQNDAEGVLEPEQKGSYGTPQNKPKWAIF